MQLADSTPHLEGNKVVLEYAAFLLHEHCIHSRPYTYCGSVFGMELHCVLWWSAAILAEFLVNG